VNRRARPHLAALDRRAYVSRQHASAAGEEGERKTRKMTGLVSCSIACSSSDEITISASLPFESSKTGIFFAAASKKF